MTGLISYLSIMVAFASTLFAAHLVSQKGGMRFPTLYMSLLFSVISGQSLMLATVINGVSPDWVAIVRPSLATTIGPLVFLYINGVYRSQVQFRKTNLLHTAPAIVIALQLISGVFLISIDLIIISSFVFYTVLVGKIALAKKQPNDRFLNCKTNIDRLAVFSALLLAISAAGEFAIYVDVLSGSLLKESAPLLIVKANDVIIAACIMLLALRTPSLFQWQPDALPVKTNESLAHQGDLGRCVDAFEALASSADFFSTEKNTVRDVAKRLSLPPRQLSDAINIFYGESFSRRMNRLRVAEAKRLIRANPDTSLTEILFDAGFRTKSSFNREFRLITGCTPSAYRESLRNDA